MGCLAVGKRTTRLSSTNLVAHALPVPHPPFLSNVLGSGTSWQPGAVGRQGRGGEKRRGGEERGGEGRRGEDGRGEGSRGEGSRGEGSRGLRAMSRTTEQTSDPNTFSNVSAKWYSWGKVTSTRLATSSLCEGEVGAGKVRGGRCEWGRLGVGWEVQVLHKKHLHACVAWQQQFGKVTPTRH